MDAVALIGIITILAAVGVGMCLAYLGVLR
jgi:hypothetical protein